MDNDYKDFEKEFEEQIAELYEEFEQTYKKLGFKNVTRVITLLMERAAKFERLSGEKKKRIVLHCLRELIKDNVRSKQNRMVLLTMVDLTFPELIDGMVSASKGEFIFKTVKKGLLKWCCT